MLHIYIYHTYHIISYYTILYLLISYTILYYTHMVCQETSARILRFLNEGPVPYFHKYPEHSATIATVGSSSEIEANNTLARKEQLGYRPKQVNSICVLTNDIYMCIRILYHIHVITIP